MHLLTDHPPAVPRIIKSDRSPSKVLTDPLYAAMANRAARVGLQVCTVRTLSANPSPSPLLI